MLDEIAVQTLERTSYWISGKAISFGMTKLSLRLDDISLSSRAALSGSERQGLSASSGASGSLFAFQLARFSCHQYWHG